MIQEPIKGTASILLECESCGAKVSFAFEFDRLTCEWGSSYGGTHHCWTVTEHIDVSSDKDKIYTPLFANKSGRIHVLCPECRNLYVQLKEKHDDGVRLEDTVFFEELEKNNLEFMK